MCIELISCCLLATEGLFQLPDDMNDGVPLRILHACHDDDEYPVQKKRQAGWLAFVFLPTSMAIATVQRQRLTLTRVSKWPDLRKRPRRVPR